MKNLLTTGSDTWSLVLLLSHYSNTSRHFIIATLILGYLVPFGSSFPAEDTSCITKTWLQPNIGIIATSTFGEERSFWLKWPEPEVFYHPSRVTPSCFLRHNGISRIHRVAKSIKLNVHYLRWMAKINYEETEMYGTRELIEISKSMTSVSGIQCAWVHPLIDSRLDLIFKKICQWRWVFEW